MTMINYLQILLCLSESKEIEMREFMLHQASKIIRIEIAVRRLDEPIKFTRFCL